MNIFRIWHFWLAIFGMVMGTGGWSLYGQAPITPASCIPPAVAETSTVLQVVDAYGAPIAKAHVTVRGEGGKEFISDYANQEGMLKISSLPPGLYVVSVAAAGFENMEKGFSIDLNQTQKIKLVLEVRFGCEPAMNCDPLEAELIFIDPIQATSPTMIEPYVLPPEPEPRAPGFFKRLISWFRRR